MTEEEFHGFALELELTDGGLRVVGGDDMPPEVMEELHDMLHHATVQGISRQIRRYVTPEVANHVLSAYGDEQASMPSLAVSALITLIRTCHISDEGMLEVLNEASPVFHGYVLATTLLGESGDGSGLPVLRKLAGLDPDDDEPKAGP